MTRLKTIIVDDEPDSIQLLQLQLAQYCPEIEISGAYTSSVKALDAIEKIQPDLLFLDIEMPVMNGFELLEKILHIPFSVIFITAYNQYALKAFRFNAVDYLVKPVDGDDLIEAVAKAIKRIKPSPTQLSQMQKQLRGEPATRIAIPGQQGGISFIDLNDIIYSEASNNYTKIILDRREPVSDFKNTEGCTGGAGGRTFSKGTPAIYRQPESCKTF